MCITDTLMSCYPQKKWYHPLKNSSFHHTQRLLIILGQCQWSERLQLKQEALGSIPGGYPGFLSLVLVQMDEGSVVL